MSLFALRTLFADRGKLLTALVGVVFALVLVNVQGGLYFGLMQKASVLTDKCGADLWVGHRLVENVDFAHPINEIWLNRIRGLDGVERAEPYIVGKGIATLSDGGYEDVWIIGADPATMLGGGWSFAQGSRDDLLRSDGISFDELDARKLGNPRVGDIIEINQQRARIVATTHGVLGFVTTPYLFTNLNAARRYSNMPEGTCSYFLVQARPGTDLWALQSAIQRQVPDLDVYTADEFSQLSREYFLERTGIGISFGAATLLGVIVGLLMVAQSLYALALDHLSEYATLKAMGAEDRQVLDVVVLQALSIATMGSSVGVGLVLLIQRVASTPLAPIEIPPLLLGGGVVLVFGICLISVILPWLRIRGVDPATVLQG